VPGPVATLRTAAWYGDRGLTLHFPSAWELTVHSPVTPAPLGDAEIAARLRSPLGQPRIAELARGRSRPLIIVDDLNRPTPASRVLPALLRELAEAGVPARNVRILMAPGTHGAPPPGALAKKVGEPAAAACELHVHDCHGPVVKVGCTSFGTPVLVNPQVMESDLILGVGGIYPNQTAGFGGGVKLILGVLGFRSIANLHHRHRSVGWGSADTGSSFRRDLEEIASLVGLRASVVMLLDAHRDVVDLACGDPRTTHVGLHATKDLFRAPPPAADTRVVVANAYPNDLSLTFVRMKGMAPLGYAPAGASRVVIASCPEGLGFHGLFPFLNGPRHHAARMLAMRVPMLAHRPRELVRKLGRRLGREASSWLTRGRPSSAPAPPIWLYRPPAEGGAAASLPAAIPGMRAASSWDEILEAVRREQGGEQALKAELYVCTPLQWIG